MAANQSAAQEMTTVVLDGEMALQTHTLDGEMALQIHTLDGEMGVFTAIGDTKLTRYGGEYVITPMAYEDKVLETENTVMEHNVTIQQIPYYKVSNDSGYTITIGG